MSAAESAPDRERDAVARAWRDASGEMPSAALDDAIRAAARRATQSGPTQVARRRRTPGPWWPLAAAAAVGVIAFGLVRLVPHEASSPALSVEDTVSQPATPPPAAPEPIRNSDATAANSAQPNAATATQKHAERAPDAPRPTPSRGPAAKIQGEAAKPAEPRQDPRPSPRAMQSGAPATAPSRDGAAPASRADAAPASGEGVAPSAPETALPSARDTAAPSARERAEAAASAAPSTEATATGESSSASKAVAPALERRLPLLRTPTLAAAPKVARTTMPFDDWIRVVRDLVRDDRPADAKRELARLREAYPERELPPDLRSLLPALPADRR